MKSYIVNSKHRALLKGAAMTIDPIFAIGKNSLTTEFIQSVTEYLDKNEILKVTVLKNCDDDPKEIAVMLAERSDSELVQVIGRKIVLYKPLKEEKKRKYSYVNGGLSRDLPKRAPASPSRKPSASRKASFLKWTSGTRRASERGKASATGRTSHSSQRRGSLRRKAD